MVSETEAYRNMNKWLWIKLLNVLVFCFKLDVIQ